ncbi:MAG: arginine transporter, partial [Pseudomonadota bacterium]
MRIIISLTILLALAACGGGRSDGRSDTSARVAFASGPMYDACLAAGRKNASRALCGCIQAQANRDLSARDQARAATFFADPQRAQDT